MRTFTLTFALSALAAYATAQSNTFNNPPGGYSFKPGQPTDLTWSNTKGSTVTLTLRSGSNGDLDKGTVIQANVPNNGKYTWNVPKDLPSGGSYTIQIQDDQDPANTNFTPQFPVQNPNGANSATNSAATGSATASGSATATATGKTDTASVTSGAATKTNSADKTKTKTGTDTASTTGSAAASTAAASTTASGSGSATSSASRTSGSASVPSNNAGSSNHVVFGGSGLALAAALGLVAL